MKKLILSCALILLLLLTGIVVLAVENTQEQEVYVLENMRELLNSQITSEEKAILGNKSYYAQDEDYDLLNNNPIVKIYNTVYWEYSYYETAEVVAKAEKRKSVDYVIFSDEVLRANKGIFNGDIEIGIYKTYEEVPTFLMDIINMDTNIKIDDEECIVQNVICFDGISSYEGIVVYIVTDKGTYVKYYEYYDSESLIFTVEEFQKYGSDYYQFITSPEYLYDDEGNKLIGGAISFKDYLENKAEYDNSINKNNGITNQLWFWCVCSGVLIVIVVVVVIIKISSRRGK